VARRTDRKPADFVRCHRCGRLCLRSSSTVMGGVRYGPECLAIAFARGAETEEDRIRRELAD
jgi:late competence protein required for DNA uptake (superfamily II DNA/RNA helicase)